MFTLEQIKEVVTQVRYLDWDILVRVDGERPYIQVYGHGPDPNEGMKNASWSSRKWFVSPHMCKNEIIRTAYKAIQAAVEHEMNEFFLYRGQQIFSPHMNYDITADMMAEIDCKDSRDGGMQGV